MGAGCSPLPSPAATGPHPVSGPGCLSIPPRWHLLCVVCGAWPPAQLGVPPPCPAAALLLSLRVVPALGRLGDAERCSSSLSRRALGSCSWPSWALLNVHARARVACRGWSRRVTPAPTAHRPGRLSPGRRPPVSRRPHPRGCFSTSWPALVFWV